MNTFRTLIVPADKSALAVAITDALGYPEKGMFTAEVDASGSVVGYISTGILDDASPVLADAATLHAAIQARGGTATLADCTAFVQALDATPDEPFGRMDFIREEIALGATAVPWVQPTGAHDAYSADAVVSHGGKAWRNLTPANVWAPGVTGWRLLWASEQSAPAWVSPTGAHDAYRLGAIVTHKGKTWKNTGSDANVWEPGVFGWTEV